MKTIEGLRIELLADHQEAIPLLRCWFEQEWSPFYGKDGPGDADKDLVDACQRDKLPLALVAFINDEVCGTAALKLQSVDTHSHLSPWLAALLVLPSYRRRGIAERIIAAIEEQARIHDFDFIYVGTGERSGTPETPLRNRGWEFMERSEYYRREISIFKKTL